MKCTKCGKETKRYTVSYKDGKKSEGCTFCLVRSVDFTPILTKHRENSYNSRYGSKLSTAHYQDIIHRKLGEGGEVIRDYGKKMFVNNFHK